jgi:hypothetical protein
MTEDELLSRRLGALAWATERHFIELIATHPLTMEELAKHFDYTAGQLQFMGNQLCALNFLAVARNPERYEYDPRGLAGILQWITRIQSIQTGPLKRESSSS